MFFRLLLVEGEDGEERATVVSETVCIVRDCRVGLYENRKPQNLRNERADAFAACRGERLMVSDVDSEHTIGVERAQVVASDISLKRRAKRSEGIVQPRNDYGSSVVVEKNRRLVFGYLREVAPGAFGIHHL